LWTATQSAWLAVSGICHAKRNKTKPLASVSLGEAERD
jgi:hypothetical protein